MQTYDENYRRRHDPPHSATWSAERRAAAWEHYDREHGDVSLLPTGHEDTEGWAFKRARTHEATLSPEEVIDAGVEGVDVRAVAFVGPLNPHNGFARFNGRWFVPLTRTAVSSGLDPTTNPGEFIALDDAECMALERVVSHWRSQAEGDADHG